MKDFRPFGLHATVLVLASTHFLVDGYGNILTPLLIFATFQFPARILAEATLSFVGLGIQAPVPSWGNMLSGNRGYLLTQPWLVLLPGIALTVVAVGVNQLGDGLRDWLDPRLRERP